METVPQIRVFLASPGDVNEERAVALAVLDMLEYDPLFKRNGAGGVSVHAVAWDKPGGNMPMRATQTPQTAIKEGLPRPSECDIVLVFFWGRIGNPLPHPEYQKDDSSPYLSGTEWEYHDAVTAERAKGRPITLIYRRTEDPVIDRKDRKALAQYDAVLNFFDQLRDPKTGAFIGGVNEYSTPEDLRVKLTSHLRMIIDGILNHENIPVNKISTDVLRPFVEAPPLWKGSPFPGLRAFTEADAPIFMGRGSEISELVKRIGFSRFVAVVAASGSGKSSLVAAGVIPRLKANAIVSGETGSKDWRYIRFTPRQVANPFASMFEALCEAFPEHSISPFLIEQEKQGFIDSITRNPKALISICEALLREAKAPVWAEILFFIDQFEELFTLICESDRLVFVALLEAINVSQRLRCVVTMRSDFYANCLEIPAMAELLKAATYPLGIPTAGALVEMIKRPAERAGLIWDDGLPERIQADTGSGSGALALMAFALDELYQTPHPEERLTFDVYNAIGGVEGAIGKRAENAFQKLTLPDKARLLHSVFRELVTVDERGTATRQRADLHSFGADERALIDAFASARLLVTEENTVEVAHEAVFHNWAWLKNWIAESQEDLILLRQVRAAADYWKRHHTPDFLRWPAERLKPVYTMIERQQPSLSEVERNFIEPEQERLLREIAALHTDHKRRRWIGERVATIGDTRFGIGLDEHGLPQIAWLPVTPGGEIEVEGQHFSVKPFYIARFPVTYPQFQVFVDAPDGFEDERWWQDFPERFIRQKLSPAAQQYDNYPRDSVSWYQACAFTRWLDAKYGELGLFDQFHAGNWQLRLPMDWEWQWMAQNGDEMREYPWGVWDEHARANTAAAGIGDRSTAVGMYPSGAAACGALDVAGNVREWCLNESDFLDKINLGSDHYRILRGGSFLALHIEAACANRYANYSDDRNDDFGLRLVVSTRVESLAPDESDL